MSKQNRHSRKGAPRRLKRLLRSLAEIDVPETVESELLASIPEHTDKATEVYSVGWFRRIERIGVSAAAAVLLFAWLLVVDHALSQRSREMPVQFRDTSLSCVILDQDNFLYDENNF